MARASAPTVEEALAAPLPPSVAEALPEPNINDMVNNAVQAAVSTTIASAVAEAIAGALPALVTAVQQKSAKEPQFASGMAPSESVFMSIVPGSAVKADYLKHYRMDDTPSAKFIELDMDKIEAGADVNDAALKGSWIHFMNDHFYAVTPNQVRFIDWRIANDPGFRAYEDEVGAVLPCIVANCTRSFATEAGLKAHLAATHKVVGQ